MVAKFKPKEDSLLMLIIELSVLDYSLNYFLSSQIAAAAVHFTIQVIIIILIIMLIIKYDNC